VVIVCHGVVHVPRSSYIIALQVPGYEIRCEISDDHSTDPRDVRCLSDDMAGSMSESENASVYSQVGACCECCVYTHTETGQWRG
jgi:hypothetical protein